jgi:Malectin domain
MRRIIVLLEVFMLSLVSLAGPVNVILKDNPSKLESMAAGELVRYLNLVTLEGARLNAESGEIRVGVQLSGIATPTTPESCRLKFEMRDGKKTFHISGADPLGVLYGAYAFLEKQGITFTITEDIFPDEKQPLIMPDIDEVISPRFGVRGLLPWHDFLNGPSAWDLADYQDYINQMLKLRMNTLMLHVYSRTYSYRNWSEPFLGFAHKGVGHHAFLDTSLTERWGNHGYRTQNFPAGADRLFHRRAFGSEAAQFAPNQAAVYQRARGMMQQVVSYAQRMGLKVVLGFEINMLPEAIVNTGANPFDEDLIRTRLKDLLDTYPTVDCVQIWYSEFHKLSAEEFAGGLKTVHKLLGEMAPGKKLATGGWWMESHFPELDKLVPLDIVFSTLTTYQGGVHRAYGQLQKGRERWTVPWLEFDGNMWVPQPFITGFRKTMQQASEKEMEGVLGIHWRTNELDANFEYLARGMWGELPTTTQFYQRYAAARYGGAADKIKDILIDLEGLDLFAGNDSHEFADVRPYKHPHYESLANDLGALHIRLLELEPSIPKGECKVHWQHLVDTLDWSSRFYAIQNRTAGLKSWDDVLEHGILESIQAYARRVSTPSEQGSLSSIICKYYHNYRKVEDKIREGMEEQPPPLSISSCQPAVLVSPRNKPALAGTPYWLQIIVAGQQETPGVVLHYRASGDGEWQSKLLSARLRNTYFGAIPPEHVRLPGLQYYIEVGKGANAMRWPVAGATMPCSVRVDPVEGAAPDWQCSQPSASANVDYIALSWEGKGKQPPADYQILRKTENDGWVDYARTFGNVASFVDDEVESRTMYQYRLIPIGSNGAQGGAVDSELIKTPRREKVVIHINCAGRDYLDGEGVLWRGDHVYNPLEGSGYLEARPFDHWLTGQDVKGTADMELYRSIRYSESGTLHYRFEVPNGSYTLGYRAAEIYYGVDGRKGGAGTRVFSASAEGTVLFESLDLTERAGGNTALELVFKNIEVKDGTFNLWLSAEKDFPAICALWLRQE